MDLIIMFCVCVVYIYVCVVMINIIFTFLIVYRRVRRRFCFDELIESFC